jgi:hypothetical protein
MKAEMRKWLKGCMLKQEVVDVPGLQVVEEKTLVTRARKKPLKQEAFEGLPMTTTTSAVLPYPSPAMDERELFTADEGSSLLVEEEVKGNGEEITFRVED